MNSMAHIFNHNKKLKWCVYLCYYHSSVLQILQHNLKPFVFSWCLFLFSFFFVLTQSKIRDEEGASNNPGVTTVYKVSDKVELIIKHQLHINTSVMPEFKSLNKLTAHIFFNILAVCGTLKLNLFEKY